MSTSKQRRKTAQCPNCNTKLTAKANFCPSCGQENHDLKVPIGHLLYEFVESIFHIDTKLWATTKAIFTRPGLITRDFLEGRRARYVPPARLYIFVSFVFFLLIGKFADYKMGKSSDTPGGKNTGGIVMTMTLSDLIANDSLVEARGLDTVGRTKLMVPSNDSSMLSLIRHLKTATPRTLDSLLDKTNLDPTDVNRRKLREIIGLLADDRTLEYAVYAPGLTLKFPSDSARRAFQAKVGSMTDAEVDSVIRKTNATPNSLRRLFVRQSGKLLNFENQDTQHNLIHTILKYLSTIMFILMPFVAFLLLMIYYRRGRYYYEHLIFSVHIHTVIFLFFSLALLVTFPLNSDLTERVLSWLTLVCWVYFLLSIKQVYQQSWPKTILKFMLLSLTYTMVASAFLVIAIFAGLLTF